MLERAEFNFCVPLLILEIFLVQKMSRWSDNPTSILSLGSLLKYDQ